jgi:hypothetical protein
MSLAETQRSCDIPPLLQYDIIVPALPPSRLFLSPASRTHLLTVVVFVVVVVVVVVAAAAAANVTPLVAACSSASCSSVYPYPPSKFIG